MRKASLPEIIPDFLCCAAVDAVGAHEFFDVCALDGFGRTKMVQQSFLARCTDAGDIVQTGNADCFGAAGAVGADGEAVGFVA